MRSKTLGCGWKAAATVVMSDRIEWLAIASRLPLGSASCQAWATHSSLLVLKGGFLSDWYATGYKDVTAHPSTQA